MLPYWILFAMPAWLAIKNRNLPLSASRRWSQMWWFVFFFLVLMIGLRHEVGGDWGNYLHKINEARGITLKETINKTSELGYYIFNWIAAQYTLGIYFVNTVSALFFTWGLITFCRIQPRSWLAMLVAIPYLVIVVAMGYTRQGTAIGFGMLGMVALADRRIFRFMLFVALAAMFHKSAVLLVPLAALSNPRKKLWNTFWSALFFILLYSQFMESSMVAYQGGYVERELMSAGAAIRVTMNAVPGALFLFFRKRFALSKTDRLFWTFVAIIALVFVVLLQVSPSSTAVDRVALYFIPLQLVVLSRVPEVFGKSEIGRSNMVMLVILYSALVQLVWLLFATHAGWWLPYQFYPWVWLTQ